MNYLTITNKPNGSIEVKPATDSEITPSNLLRTCKSMAKFKKQPVVALVPITRETSHSYTFTPQGTVLSENAYIQ